MPAIPEGQCGTVVLTMVDTDAVYVGSDPDYWQILAPNTSTQIARADFPGSAGGAANGWSVTGNFASVSVCAPLGSFQSGNFIVRIYDTAGNPPGTTLKYYQGTFTITPAPTPCARPAPPEFKAANAGSTIKLTGTK